MYGHALEKSSVASPFRLVDILDGVRQAVYLGFNLRFVISLCVLKQQRLLIGGSLLTLRLDTD
jgi:hypothetical protein